MHFSRGPAVCFNLQQRCKGEPPGRCCPGGTPPSEVGAPPRRHRQPRVTRPATYQSPEGGTGAQVFLRATVWTRRPLADKPPIDHRLAVTARAPGCVPHTSAPVSFGRRHGRQRAQMHGCEIYDVKISFIWAQSATLLRTQLRRWARNAVALLLARCRAAPAAYVETCKRVFLSHWPSACPTNLKTRASVNLLI